MKLNCDLRRVGGHLNKKILSGGVGILPRAVPEMRSSSQNNGGFLVKHDVYGNWQKLHLIF